MRWLLVASLRFFQVSQGLLGFFVRLLGEPHWNILLQDVREFIKLGVKICKVAVNCM
jgi:hypothetical protein